MISQLSYALKPGNTGTALHTQRLLAISEQKKSGLILCKGYHAEFAGPGAVVSAPVEQGYTLVIAIGSPEIVEVATSEERQKAYGRRIQWIRWLQKMTDSPDPTQRAERLLSSFEAFFGAHLLLRLPIEALAQLVGVLPQTIAAVRAQHRHLAQIDESELIACTRPESSVLILTPDTIRAISALPTPFTVSASSVETLYAFPYSA